MESGYDTVGPATFFAIVAGSAIAGCVATFFFVLATAFRLFPICLPALSLRPSDPTVLSLLGVCVFGAIAASFAIIAQNVEGTCSWAYNAAGCMYVLCFWCVNLFLLAKLRAVEAGLKASWYVKLHKIINISTVFGSPLFCIVDILVLRGVRVPSKQGLYFCNQHAPWVISLVFVIMQIGISMAYLLLFLMPLISTEKHVIELRTGDRGKAVHEVIVRNLKSCILSVGSTCVLITIYVIAAGQESVEPSMWATSAYYLDLAVNIGALLYAIHPAWKYHPLGTEEYKAHTTRRVDALHLSKSQEPSSTNSPQTPSGPSGGPEHASKRSTTIHKDRGARESSGGQFVVKVSEQGIKSSHDIDLTANANANANHHPTVVSIDVPVASQL